MATQMRLEVMGNRMATCKAETAKESIRRKQKAEIFSISVLSKVLSLD